MSKESEEANKVAEEYAKKNIIPRIDDLIDNHKGGRPITRDDVESIFGVIMDKMVGDGLMTQDEMDDYTAPKENGELSRFDQEIESIFKGKDQLEAPNLMSKKDSLLHAVGKMCASCGLTKIAGVCRKGISSENRDKLNNLETGMINLVSDLAVQAKAVGEEMNKSLERAGEQTEKAMNKRQGIKPGASNDLVEPQPERVTSKSSNKEIQDTGFKDHAAPKGKTSLRPRSPSRGDTGGASRSIF